MRNRFAGNCCVCKKHVPPGKGFFEIKKKGNGGPYGSKWNVRCKDCVGKGAPSKQKEKEK